MSKDLKLNPHTTANVLFGLAIAGMVGAFIWDRFVPPARPAMTIEARIDQAATVRRETYELREEAKAFQAITQQYGWSDQAEAVGAQALDAVTRRCRANQVVLGAFRPQRSVREGALERLPFVATLDGSYLAVLRTIRALETGEDRLAVTLVQINQADPMGDRVNATLGLSAFRRVAPVRTPTRVPAQATTRPTTRPATSAPGGRS